MQLILASINQPRITVGVFYRHCSLFIEAATVEIVKQHRHANCMFEFRKESII